MSEPRKWQFKARFRRSAYGWKGSALASKRLREAVSEIKKVARKDPGAAADGVVALFERLWPALEEIDSSSGRLGMAVNRTIEALLPILIDAPADVPTRQLWLERLYEAVCDDGVDLLAPVEYRWGEICAFPELIEYWLDFLLSGLVRCLKEDRPGECYIGECICLSCLLEAGRYDELKEVLSLRRFCFWPYDRFWGEALLRMGRTDEAIAYAESRNPDDYELQSVLLFCERALLEAGRADEAYREYGLLIRSGNTYLSSYGALLKKYPERDPEQVLRDLIETSVKKGKWFAAARQAGYLDIARECARTGLVQPKTLVTAARDTLESDPGFSFEIALRALDLMLAGYGYELMVIDIHPAFNILFEAADAMGVDDWAVESVKELLVRGPAKNDPACADYLGELLERRLHEPNGGGR
jgi:tetratricopeptide (TPR) repeat protein